jgi:hypothetical protein
MRCEDKGDLTCKQAFGNEHVMGTCTLSYVFILILVESIAESWCGYINSSI